VGPISPISPAYIPLIVEHEVIVAPSASALAAIIRQTSMRKPAERGVIVFADPVFSSSDDRVSQESRHGAMGSRADEMRRDDPTPDRHGALPKLSRLSATDWEARQIARLAGDNKITSKVISNFAASREAAMDPALGEYRFIHFATHAIINQENPDLSAIALSQVDEWGRPLNGLLSAQDIHHLRLSAELVVLSAGRNGLCKDAPSGG